MLFSCDFVLDLVCNYECEMEMDIATLQTVYSLARCLGIIAELRYLVRVDVTVASRVARNIYSYLIISEPRKR